MTPVSNYGVVAVVSPPVLKLVDQPALIKFETEYSVYKSKVEDVNKDRDVDSKIKLASIKDCIDPSTLHALCIMGEISGAESVDEATDDDVQAWFDKASTVSPKDLSERIDAALDSVSYAENREDPAGGVTNFIVKVITALDRNNASDVLKDKDLAKHFVDRLVKKFKNKVLQERIKMRRRGWNKSQLADIKFFKNEVGALAIELALTEAAQQRVGAPRTSRNGRTKDDEEDKTDENVNKKRKNKKGRKVWTDKCLNPECDKRHPLKDCKITDKKRKRELFDEHYKLKEGNNPKELKVLPSTVSNQPNADEGRFQVSIEDSVLDIILGDSGSDFNAIAASTLKKVKEAKPSLVVEPLESPIVLVGAFKTNEDSFSASAKVNLTITIFLPGSRIPLRIRGVDFLVVDNEMDELLLGRPFLKSIGFDFKEHLLRIHSEIHDKDVSEIDPNILKSAAASYTGLSYTEADDDPIEPTEAIGAGIGKDSEEVIDLAFEKIILDAKKNGMSKKGLERVKHMLKKYRDVFRIKLSNDPPARVDPLTITPIPNAKPYRSPQRRYAPHQRKFICQTIRELEAVGAIYRNPSARLASPTLAVP